MQEAKKIVFSIVRQDLLYSYAGSLEEIFAFTDVVGGEPTSESGVRRQESEGFDFTSECKPTVTVRPCAEILSEETGITSKDLVLNISIEDLGLRVRRIVYEIPVEQVVATEKRTIDLNSLDGMAFHLGYAVRCFVTRRNTIKKGKQVIWHKSQVIFEKSFIANTTRDDGLFEINWVNFNDPLEKKDLLFYIRWNDSDVTSLVATDTFQVFANESQRQQFKRLENNSNFGHFATRLIAQDILRELTITCLQNADLSIEPAVDSLHDKIKALLERCDLSFEEVAKRCQSGDSTDMLNARSEVYKLLQREHLIASELGKIKFGGYRAV
jgi:hypothetical protein